MSATPRPGLLALLERLNPLRRAGQARRTRILREAVVPLHGFLGKVHEQYVLAYETLMAELHADPKYASNRIIDSVQDARRHLKTYQLLLGEGKHDTDQAWMTESSRLEVLGHALVWSSKAFKAARDRLAAAAREPDAREARRTEAYFQALTMYHTIRSRGSLTFRLYPDRLGRPEAGFRPSADVEALAGAERAPAPQVVTFLVYERTDESVTRNLHELIEGALWTKKSNWRAVESAYRELMAEIGA
jgi:hypothetical protein